MQTQLKYFSLKCPISNSITSTTDHNDYLLKLSIFRFKIYFLKMIPILLHVYIFKELSTSGTTKTVKYFFWWFKRHNPLKVAIIAKKKIYIICRRSLCIFLISGNYLNTPSTTITIDYNDHLLNFRCDISLVVFVGFFL